MPSEGLPTQPHNQSKTRLSQQHLELELGLELGLDQVLGSVFVVRAYRMQPVVRSSGQVVRNDGTGVELCYFCVGIT